MEHSSKSCLSSADCYYLFRLIDHNTRILKIFATSIHHLFWLQGLHTCLIWKLSKEQATAVEWFLARPFHFIHWVYKNSFCYSPWTIFSSHLGHLFSHMWCTLSYSFPFPLLANYMKKTCSIFQTLHVLILSKLKRCFSSGLLVFFILATLVSRIYKIFVINSRDLTYVPTWQYFQYEISS